MRDVRPLTVVATIVLCPLLSRALSGSRSFVDVYERPAPLQPPSWVFGPVWTLLYGLLGYALGVSLSGDAPADVHRSAPIDMTALLALNVAWTPLFLRQYVSVALGLLLLMTAQAAWVVDRSPGLAPWVGPYIAWLCFASYLNSVYAARQHRGTLRAAAGV